MTHAHEWQRILFVQERDGMGQAREFVKRTYAKYRECLRMRGPVAKGKKLHHASLPTYRRTFIESCVVFREYLRKTRWVDHGLDGLVITEVRRYDIHSGG